jgi:broad specificity phosphatase PhoE
MKPTRTRMTIAALAVSAALAGCGSGIAPSRGVGAGAPPVATPGVVAPASLVMVIRHAEKPDGETDGVDARGREDDSSLTPTGWDRAHRLVDLFDPAQGSPRPGLGRPATIYAADANDEGRGQRTRETVAPLADRLRIATDTTFGKGDEEDLVEHVITRPGPALISWQHSGIPSIADAFPSVTPAPPSEWPDDRFDVVWTFTKTADGWQFAQLPELVLPGDRPDPIED